MFRIEGRARAGFALIDVLVVVAILLVVAGLVVPGIQKARERATQIRRTSIRVLAIAAHMAHDQNKTFPPYFGPYCGKNTGTFHYHLLPFVENVALWRAPDPNGVVDAFISVDDPTLANHGAGAANRVVNLRLFYTNGGLGELKTGETPVLLKMGQITDGTSQTLLFATKYHHCGANGGSLWLDPGNNAPSSPTAATFGASMALWQTAPTKENCNPLAGTAVSLRPEAIQVVFVDASVHAISPSVSPAVWLALHTPGGNDLVNFDQID